MKTQKTVRVYFFVMIFSYAFISCEKETDKVANCRIVTTTTTQTVNGMPVTIVNSISYNNDSQMSTISTTGSVTRNKVFIYTGNTIIVNTTNETGSLIARDSVTLDNQGRPLNIRQYSSGNPGTWINSIYEYSGEDLVRTLQTTQSSSTPVIGTCTSSNGNLVRLESSAGNSSFEYYTDEPFQQGDGLNMFFALEIGVGIIPHKNLAKTFDTGRFIFNFSYEMNDDGLISRLTSTEGSSATTITYQYECD